jgi:hypothetical protein
MDADLVPLQRHQKHIDRALPAGPAVVAAGLVPTQEPSRSHSRGAS